MGGGGARQPASCELVGVGSLLVRDTVEPGTPQPGNMFVPIDLLKPILADMKAKGRTGGPQRPWLGPEHRAGAGRTAGEPRLARGAGGQGRHQAGRRRSSPSATSRLRDHEELYRKLWALGAAGVEVPLKVQQGVDVREVRVKSIDRFEYFKSKQAF